MVKKYIDNFAFVLAGLAVSTIYFVSKNIFNIDNTLEIYKILSDGFFLPAVLLVGVGLLMYVSNTGFFDIFSFSFSSVKQRFKKDSDKDAEFPKTFYDYKQKHKSRKLNLAKPLLSGCFFLVVAIVFCILFIYA